MLVMILTFEGPKFKWSVLPSVQLLNAKTILLEHVSDNLVDGQLTIMFSNDGRYIVTLWPVITTNYHRQNL